MAGGISSKRLVSWAITEHAPSPVRANYDQLWTSPDLKLPFVFLTLTLSLSYHTAQFILWLDFPLPHFTKDQ